MKILIKSRKWIEQRALLPFTEKTALISICDCDLPFAELRNAPDYLLQLRFNDVDADVFEDELGDKPSEEEKQRIEQKYHMISWEQAKEISQFFDNVKKDVEVLICQCEHGQSRSAAVAAAIKEYMNRSGITIFANDKYYPNKFVFRRVFKMMGVKRDLE